MILINTRVSLSRFMCDDTQPQLELKMITDYNTNTRRIAEASLCE